VSEVPLGGFLSGGVDSSGVVALMAQASERVKTFSVGFTDPRFDELRYARMVAEQYRTEHHEQTVTLDILEMLDRVVAQFDEPFADSSAIPTMYLARMTREHVTVALSGDGADEVFGGYRRYRFGVLEERIRSKVPGWARRSVFGMAGRFYPKFDYLPQVFRGKTLLTNLAQERADSYFTSVTAFRDGGLAAVLSPELKRELAGYSPRDGFRKRFEAVRHLGPLEQMQAVDFQTYLPGDILVKADRASMAFSLELRSPWLDHELAELALTLPTELKLAGRTGKYVFKRALARHLPPAVTERRKMGFSVPLANWFRSTLRPVFDAAVLDPTMDRYLERREVRRLWVEHQSGLHDHSRKLWNLLTLALWDRAHNPHTEPRQPEAEMRARVEVN
jgi:asparagine synthase (glutamine-hydrolysing)